MQSSRGTSLDEIAQYSSVWIFAAVCVGGMAAAYCLFRIILGVVRSIVFLVRVRGELDSLSVAMARTIGYVHASASIAENHFGSASYICSVSGECTSASAGLCKLFGRDVRDMEGFRWTEGIDERERARVASHWLDCVRRDREYFATYTIVRPDGQRIKCTTRAYKIIDGKQAVCYIGVVIPQD